MTSDKQEEAEATSDDEKQACFLSFVFNSSLVTCHSSLVTAFMRLDLFLKASRLCPRRSVAQELCEAGGVLLNGVPAKQAREVRAGDKLTIRRRDQWLTVRVLSIPTSRQTSRSEASTLYEILESSPAGEA